MLFLLSWRVRYKICASTQQIKLAISKDTTLSGQKNHPIRRELSNKYIFFNLKNSICLKLNTCNHIDMAFPPFIILFQIDYANRIQAAYYKTLLRKWRKTELWCLILKHPTVSNLDFSFVTKSWCPLTTCVLVNSLEAALGCASHGSVAMRPLKTCLKGISPVQMFLTLSV